MYYNQNAKSPFDSLFQKHAQSNGLRYDFLRNIAQIESGYRADARPPIDSKTGKRASSAAGVMQLVQGTGREVGLNTDADFMDPDKNIGGGAKYLARMLKLSGGNEMRAALAYHSGPGSEDIKHYDKGEYDKISPAGRDYLNKVNGNAIGDPHATSHFNSSPMKAQELPSNLNQTTPKLDALQNAPQFKNTQAFQAPTEPVEGIDVPDPYRLPGTPPSQQEDDSFLGRHGFGFFEDTVNTAALNSEMNTITEAHNAGNWGTVGDLLHPARQLSKDAVAKVRASNLRPEYFSMVNGATDENIDTLINLAQEHQDREDEMATKKVGLGSQVAGGAVSLASDPTNLALMVQPEIGVPAFLEKLGGGSLLKWGIKSAYKTGTNAAYDATVGSLGLGAHTAITGGDFNAGDAAVTSVMMGAGFRGAGKVLGYGGKFVRNPEATLTEIGDTLRGNRPTVSTTTTEAPVSTSEPTSLETGGVSQTVRENVSTAPTATSGATSKSAFEYNASRHSELETQHNGGKGTLTPSEYDELTAYRMHTAQEQGVKFSTTNEDIANRLVHSESARTNMEPDPTLHTHNENTEFHNNGDNTHYAYAEPNENLAQDHDVLDPSGKRFDSGNPFNAHTQTVDGLIEEAVNSGKAYRAAYSFGDAINAGIRKITAGKLNGIPSLTRNLGMNELGYEITREGIHPTIRGFGMMLANPATGLRDLTKSITEGWIGQRLGKLSAQEIKEAETRSNLRTLANLKRAEKRMLDIPEYQFSSSDGSPLSPHSDAEKLDMMRRDIDTAIRNGDITTLPKEMQEYAQYWRDHFNEDKANKLLDPESSYAMPGAKPIISDNLADGTYLPAHYDRPAIHDTEQTEFNGDKEAMQNALTEGDMDAYLRDPRVRKRVDDQLQAEHLSDDAMKARQKEVNTLEKERQKAQDKLDKLNQKKDDLGESRDHREQMIQDTLQKRGLGSDVEIQAKVEEAVQKRLQRFKTAPNEDRIAKVYQEERLKLQKFIDEVATEADRKSRNIFSNLNRDIRTAEEKIAKRVKKIDEINTKMKEPLTKDELLERARKLSHDSNYGIIHEIDEDPNTLQAIEKALDKNPIAGIANANSLRARSPFGYEGEFTTPTGRKMRKADMLSHDHDRTFALYNRQMDGHLAIVGSTGLHFKDFMTALNTAKKEITGISDGVEKTAEHISNVKAFKDVDEMLKLIAGRARVDDPNSMARTLTKMLSTYGYATKNGWFGYDNLGEASSLYSRGVYQWFSDLTKDTVEPMMNQAKHVKAYRDEIQDTLFGDEVFHDMVSTKENLRRGMVDSGINPSTAKHLASIQYGITKGSEILPGSLMLHYSINSLTELAEKQAIGSIVREVAEGKSSIYLTEKQFKSAGLTPEQGAKIKDLLAEHAQVMPDGTLKLKNRDAFLADSRTVLLKRLTRRVAKDTLLLEDMGQTMTRAAGPVSQTLLMFKRFGMKAMNAKMMRSWHEAAGNGRKVEKALELSTSLGVQSALQYFKVYARSLSMDDETAKEYRDMMLSPGMFAFTLATRTPMLAVAGNASNIAAMMGSDWANNVRTTTQPMLPSRHQYEPQTTNKLLESVGGGLMRNISGAQTVADAYNIISQGIRYYTADQWKDHADAAYLVRDSMRRLTPFQDPITMSIQRHMFEASTGLDWDKPNSQY